MSKLFTENGFLSEEGKKIFSKSLDKEVEQLLNTAENENELRLIASLIHQRIGNITTDRVLAKNQLTNQFNSMTDDQFYDFLKDKYGAKWMLTSLTREEFERCPVPSREEMRSAIEQGIKDRQAAMDATPMVRIDRNLRFK